mgnify:FL=1
MANYVATPKKFLIEKLNKKCIKFEQCYLNKRVWLIYPYLFKYFLGNNKFNKINHPFFGKILETKNSLFIKNNITSPNAAIQTEIVSILKSTQVIQFGIAGSIVNNLKIGDLIITKGAINETGTGKIYGYPFDKIINSDKDLSQELMLQIKCKKIKFANEFHWCTDAPFEETLDKIKKYRNMNGVCVEMEAAGIFCAALKYNIPSTGIYIISDELSVSGEWLQGWNSQLIINTVKKIIEIF